MSHGVTAYRHPPAAFWWADLKKHLTKDPDKRTTPFHPHSQSVKHTGAVYRTKVFYTVHNLLQFLITEFSPSPFPCFCLTSSRYILDFFFCTSKLLFSSFLSFGLVFPSGTELQELELIVVPHRLACSKPYLLLFLPSEVISFTGSSG